ARELRGQSRGEVLRAVGEAGGVPHARDTGDPARAGLEHRVPGPELGEAGRAEAVRQSDHPGLVPPEPGGAQVDHPGVGAHGAHPAPDPVAGLEHPHAPARPVDGVGDDQAGDPGTHDEDVRAVRGHPSAPAPAQPPSRDDAVSTARGTRTTTDSSDSNEKLVSTSSGPARSAAASTAPCADARVSSETAAENRAEPATLTNDQPTPSRISDAMSHPVRSGTTTPITREARKMPSPAAIVSR